MFSYCKQITSVTIPSGIAKFGSFVFMQCIALQNLYYRGTMEQWAAFKLNFKNCDIPATVVHCSDGDASLKKA